ncbi:MAG TPA: FGGY family carbohydrate kinase [Candidatus Binatia bacterium]|nr:FGGY family carbohydrate kinase [Candidatus Binatia bacterium]
MDVVVGIDAGTTYCKAAVVGVGDRRELAQGRAPTPWRPVPTGHELDPEELVGAAAAAVAGALDGVPDARVAGLGVTSMAETGVLLGTGGAPLAPAIAWYDVRGDAEGRELAAAFGEDEFRWRTGLWTSSVATATKLRWLRGHAPDVVRAGRCWLNVAEWIVYRLGGRPVAELSLSCRTGWLDRDRRAWWRDALEWSGGREDLLPELVEAGTPAGAVAGDVLPRARGAVLTVAGHDHFAAALGAGATRAGDVFDSCGSAEAFVRALDGVPERGQVLAAVERGVNVAWHVLPGRRALLGGHRAGLGLDRVLRLLGVGDGGAAREALEARAVALDPPAGVRVDGVADERLAVGGLGWDASPELVWRAAVEEVARLDAELLGVLEQVAGPTARVLVAGGWSRSPSLMAAKRARLGELETVAAAEPGALGAALLAGQAAGVAAAVPGSSS